MTANKKPTLNDLLLIDVAEIKESDMIAVLSTLSRTHTIYKQAADDLEAQVKKLTARAGDHLLTPLPQKDDDGNVDLEDPAWKAKMETEQGKLARSSRENISLPKNDAGEPEMAILLEYCVKRYTEDKLPITEAFELLNNFRANPKPFKAMDEIPLGMKLGKSASVKFTPAKQ